MAARCATIDAWQNAVCPLKRRRSCPLSGIGLTWLGSTERPGEKADLGGKLERSEATDTKSGKSCARVPTAIPTPFAERLFTRRQDRPCKSILRFKSGGERRSERTRGNLRKPARDGLGGDALVETGVSPYAGNESRARLRRGFRRRGERRTAPPSSEPLHPSVACPCVATPLRKCVATPQCES